VSQAANSQLDLSSVLKAGAGALEELVSVEGYAGLQRLEQVAADDVGSRVSGRGAPDQS
jgi:hypothetical protein